jgi:Zn-dependent protease
MWLEKLNRFNLSLGSWFGIPLILHWSWLLMLLVLAVINPTFVPVWLGLFFIVVLHEFGHCLMSQRLDAPVRSVTLYPIGGMALMEIPTQPQKELMIALAGPAVNVAFIPIFAILPSNPILDQIGYVNVAILVFNLIPSFPMDGGRVLRSLLVMMLRNYVKATTIACRLSQAICLLFFLGGFWSRNMNLVLIGVVIALFAQIELERLKVRHVLEADLAASGSDLANIQRRIADLDA